MEVLLDDNGWLHNVDHRRFGCYACIMYTYVLNAKFWWAMTPGLMVWWAGRCWCSWILLYISEGRELKMKINDNNQIITTHCYVYLLPSSDVTGLAKALENLMIVFLNARWQNQASTRPKSNAFWHNRKQDRPFLKWYLVVVSRW